MNIFVDMVENLAEGHAIYPMIQDDNLLLRIINPSQLKVILSINNMVGVIGILMQPRIAEFQDYMEFTYFSPGSEANKNIICLTWKWQTMPFIIFMLPTICIDHNGNKYNSLELLREVARKFNLELKNNVLPLMVGNIELKDGSIPNIPLDNLHFLVPK